ncbi:MAG: 50S ribosomal protein L15 [Planctomyces sp.]|nr:50S ribosomal protein L15 [Planctomyces sp.]
MMLHDVNIGIQRHKTRKRVGRGPGSGHGKTSGRGHKGAGSRSGTKRRLGFEGGQKPLARRIAKRGFNNNFFALTIAEVNLSAIELVFNAGDVITPEILSSKGLAKGRFDQVKILADGEITKALSITAHRFSAAAEEKILAAGGSAVRLA